MAKSIPEVQIGNEVYELKDRTAREHLIEVKNGIVPPTSPDNKLWISRTPDTEVTVPTMDEFNELVNRLPNPPTDDGTYVLSVSVINGVAIYRWDIKD